MYATVELLPFVSRHAFLSPLVASSPVCFFSGSFFLQKEREEEGERKILYIYYAQNAILPATKRKGAVSQTRRNIYQEYVTTDSFTRRELHEKCMPSRQLDTLFLLAVPSILHKKNLQRKSPRDIVSHDRDFFPDMLGKNSVESTELNLCLDIDKLTFWFIK